MSYRDALRSLISGLKKEVKKENKEERQKIRNIEKLILLCLAIFFISFGIDFFVSEATLKFLSSAELYWLSVVYAGFNLFFLIVTTILFAIRMRYFFSSNTIIDDLRKLELRIDAPLSNEKSNQIQSIGNSILSFGISKRSTYLHPIANEKEIELEFLRILKEYHGELGEKPVFILDELDKVEARSNAGISDKEEEEPNYTESEGSIYTTQAIRKRQDVIASILANMKNFLTEAPATFIFIAGREMYDASLADVAARDSFYGSIFHDIIYVPSLIKSDIDNLPYSGISKPTEEFLFRLLCPKEIPNFKNALHDYYRLLIGTSEIKNTLSVIEEDHARKTIYILQIFIFYLIYRSNGMPKKITQLIEEHVVKIKDKKEILNTEDGQESKHQKHLVISHQKTNNAYFLKLDYKTQHKIGFINYLYRPYLVAHGRSSKFRSDKLLVSTSFLVDHILKFHNQGFSWRNLELTPEILAINKEPELRRFISNLIESLFKTRLRSIENGIHQYKFYSRIEHEIRFLSRISPADAAAFNFTLDESILIKKHYKAKINQLRKNYNSESASIETHIASIAFINNLLGDLHFFDKEYDDALVNYNDTIQSLKIDKIEKLSLKNFTLYCRVRLKMGHTYERIKAYNSSLSNYFELQQDILVYSRSFKENNDSSKKTIESTQSDQAIVKQVQNEIRVIGQSFLSSLVAIEKSALDGLTSNHLLNNLAVFKEWLETFEKSNTNDFQFIKANYFLNRGSILFFKNGNIHLTRNSWVPIFTIKTRWISTFSKGKSIKGLNQHYRPSISSLIDYVESLHWYLEVFKKTDTLSIEKYSFKNILGLISRTENKYSQFSYSGMGTSFVVSLAGLLSKLNDCLLSLQDSRSIESSFIESFVAKTPEEKELDLQQIIDDNLIFNGRNAICLKEIKQNYNLSHVITHYEIIAKLYESVGKHINASFQRRKILYVLNVLKYNPISNEQIKDEIISEISGLFKKILRGNYQGHENVIRPQILKYEMIFDHEKIYNTSHKDSKSLYNNISTSIEAKEVEILTSDLIEKLSLKSKSEIYRPSAFGHTPSVYVRYLELRSHFKKNTLDLKRGNKPGFDFNKMFWSKNNLKELSKELSSYKPSSSKQKDIIQQTCDVIFAIHTTINLFGIHGVSALFSHSLLAESHWHMAIWCQVLKVELTHTNGTSTFNNDKYNDYKTTLENLLGAGIMHRLDPKQHLEKAKEHYRKAIATHSEGNSYKQLINKMYYLEDDFNDNLSHFSITIERFYINNGAISKRLKIIQDCLEDSRLYELAHYVGEKKKKEATVTRS